MCLYEVVSFFQGDHPGVPTPRLLPLQTSLTSYSFLRSVAQHPRSNVPIAVPDSHWDGVSVA